MSAPLTYRFAADTVHLSGALVFDAHPVWRHMLRQLPAPVSDTRIRLDLAEVDSLDAAGLGLLLITHDSLSAQGARMTLTGPRGSVRRVLEVSGFAQMVTIED